MAEANSAGVWSGVLRMPFRSMTRSMRAYHRLAELRGAFPGFLRSLTLRKARHARGRKGNAMIMIAKMLIVAMLPEVVVPRMLRILRSICRYLPTYHLCTLP